MRGLSFILLLLIAQLPSLYAQTKLSVQIKGLKKSKAYLGTYEKGKPILLDSTKVDTANGTFSFERAQTLPRGMYFFDLKDQIGFQFLLNGESNARFTTQVKAIVDSMSIDGSKENEIFFDHLRYTVRKGREIDELQFKIDMLSRASRDAQALRPFYTQQQQISQSVAKFTKDMIAQNKGSLFSDYFGARQVIQPPARIPSSVNNQYNPAYLQYIRDHYWDEYPFADAAMLRSPFYPEKLTFYFQQVLVQQIDSISKGVDRLLTQAAINTEAYHYTLSWLITHFENFKRPGYDVIFVHLADRYCMSAKSIGVDTAVQMRIRYKADVMRKNLSGKIIQDLEVKDSSLLVFKLKELAPSKYTLLYFYHPLCTHCQEISPKLYQALSAYNEDALKVVAVTFEPDVNLWKSFFKKNMPNWKNGIIQDKNSKLIDDYAVYNLPTVYLLDKDKRIMGRFMEPESLLDWLGQLLK
jgi:thiol-disulfide isomerase/thioredoxin